MIHWTKRFGRLDSAFARGVSLSAVLAAASGLFLACGCGSDANDAGGPSGGSSGAGTGSAGDSTTNAGSSGSAAGGSAGSASSGVRVDRHLALAIDFGCALGSNAELKCWGTLPQDTGAVAPPSASFLSIASKERTACGVDKDSQVRCWGSVDAGSQSAATGQFSRIGVGISAYCGLRSNGSALCWGASSLVFDASVEYAQIGVGRKFACGLRATGQIDCVGSISGAVIRPPSGVFALLAVGDLHACALGTDGSIACWGEGGPDDPTDGSDANHSLWGQAIAPTGQFVDVAVGIVHSCALARDGHAVCWGAGKGSGDCSASVDNCGMAAPPADSFSELALGYSNSCGIRLDGSVACWGSNTGGRSTPPSGAL